MSATQRMMVSGRVQGVGYRNWTIWTANALGVTGWVRNVQDGRVEIMASGDDQALGALVEACREGPALARVDDIEVQAVGEIRLKGFNKRLGV
ncbi:MAG: acylphosphatase [Pseudomonadota bacterium]